mmetsp:Transcript_13738/g.19223  ORF Transcript_13738/g.19223 Transcript_13738/m.19223 type:complete len:110 (-) Transcript_13738:1223-1552(-)
MMNYIKFLIYVYVFLSKSKRESFRSISVNLVLSEKFESSNSQESLEQTVHSNKSVQIWIYRGGQNKNDSQYNTFRQYHTLQSHMINFPPPLPPLQNSSAKILLSDMLQL